MKIGFVGTLAAMLVLSGCAQTQSVGFTGIGNEGAGFGRGAITGTAARAAARGPAPTLVATRSALSAAPVDSYVVTLGDEAVNIRRVAVGQGVYAVLTHPAGGAVSPQAEHIFWLNAEALTNCRQVGTFASDAARGSVAALSCPRGL